MAADAWAPYVARASAEMILIMKDKQTLVFNKDEFQLPTP